MRARARPQSTADIVAAACARKGVSLSSAEQERVCRYLDDYPVNPFRAYIPVGGALQLALSREREILISGPAGTGKSRAALEKLNHACLHWPGARCLIVRKTRASLSESALYTLESFVLGDDNPIAQGPMRTQRAAYHYPNGSLIFCGGMDKASRIMSTEWDLIYVQEATELLPVDWESLLTRLRHHRMPYQQLFADANPSSPNHWLKLRCGVGHTQYITSRHEDNPLLYDVATQSWTRDGLEYVFDTLARLTGPRLKRLRYGIWCQAEGVVFDTWDPQIHVISRREYEQRHITRYIAGQDWGFTNPGCLLVLGIDHDGRVYVERQIYQSGRPIGWWTDTAKVEHARVGGFEAILCDPAEPGSISTYHAASLPARKADNAISLGIQNITERLAKAKDGRVRLYVVDDSLQGVDEVIRKKGLPVDLQGEMESHMWAEGDTVKEKPIDSMNHAIAALRYALRYLESGAAGWARGSAT